MKILRLRQALQIRLREAHVVELANCQASAAFEATAAAANGAAPGTPRTTTSTGALVSGSWEGCHGNSAFYDENLLKTCENL